MIAALDTYGDLYITMSQANTDQYTFSEFVKELVKTLDKDRPGWRQDTVWQVDGAKYHLTELMQDIYAKLKIPVLVSAPYSYDGAVAELFFTMFKRGHINPTSLGVSASKYFLYLTPSQLIFKM